jgi:thioesterase domain-containing protein
VSPGYWRRPELDAAAFAADPIEPDSRLYFTGDHGRIDLEGNLHFLGRSGNRVKIRGHSVDLAEVESAVAALPGVLKAAVLALQRDPTMEPDRLVAYLAVRGDAEKDPAALRRLLAATLPAHMLPAAFVFMAALPVTASGKIDRRSLAAIAPAYERHRLVEQPRNEVERAVAEVFQAMLKYSPVGRDDDFFLLGGDSLSLVELQTRLRDAFGVGVSSIHEDATVAGIAARITASRGPTRTEARSMPVMFPLRERGDAPPLFLVHGRLGQALVSPHFLRLLGDDQPVWAFQARGLDGLCDPHPTIEAMADDYLAEMRRLCPDGPYFIGALCAGALIALVMARQLRAAKQTVLPLLLLDPPERPFATPDVQMSEQGLLARLKMRHAMGRVDTPLDDPVYARSSVRVARAFELAIRQHRPVPYDGPVYMFLSRDRITRSPPAAMQKLFAGKVERFEVATAHSQILDAHNALFASSLAHCLDAIRGAARVS